MNQLDLEGSMLDLGRRRVEQDIQNAREAGVESTTRAGSLLLRTTLEHFVSGIREWFDKNKRSRSKTDAYALLDGLPIPQIGLVTCRLVLDQISRDRTYTSLASTVGDSILNEKNFRAYERFDPKAVEKTLSQYVYSENRTAARLKEDIADSDFIPEYWSAKEKLKVGAILLDLLEQSTGIIEIRTLNTYRGKRRIVVAPAEATVKWLEEAYEKSASLAPVYLPCSKPPLDWEGFRGGGYHTPGVLQRPLYSTRGSEATGLAEGSDLTVICRAVNALQATAWQVNPAVFEAMTHYWKLGGAVADLPSRQSAFDFVPTPPEGYGDNPEQLKEHKKNLSLAHQADRRLRSMRIGTARTMQVAHLFKDKESFYFPHKADWRGRIYPIPSFLDPQGSDQARGLLRFTEGRALGPTGVHWLAVHGANCWGEDKVQFDQRVQWVEDHKDHILAVGDDPISNEWWMEADKPWSFLAFCLEWTEAHWSGDLESYVSRLPVHMDGSSNGLQIFSLLLRDEVCGKSTNCLPVEEPEDIYQDVADRLTAGLYAKLADPTVPPGMHDIFRKWLEFFGGRVDRKFTKPIVMVVPYGGTQFAARDKVLEWYRQQIQEGRTDLWANSAFNACNSLVDVLWAVLQESVTSAYGCMAWMQEIASAATKAGIAMVWTSPSNFLVRQGYTTRDVDYVRTICGTAVRRLSLRRDTAKLSPRKQRSGVAPNYVHSLDAACVHLTTNRLLDDGVKSISMVHDSYATHASEVGLMQRTLREVYRDVFRPDRLSEFRDEILAQLPEGTKLPPVPPFGSLNVESLTEADYFFA